MTVLEHRDGLVEAIDSKKAGQWVVAFDRDQSPTAPAIGGDKGVLTDPVTLPARGEVALPFLPVGEHQAGLEPRARFKSIPGRTKSVE